MIHESELLDKLSDLDVESFSGEIFRVTPKSLDSLAPSSNGGRWMRKGEASVLYTSLSSDGALSELTYHWGMLSPLPSKPAVLSSINVDITASLRILRTSFKYLGIDELEYKSLDYRRMQDIGAAAAFLECHGIIVPSARWDCENLVLFTDNLRGTDVLELNNSCEVDWQKWGKENGLLDIYK